MEGRDSIFLIGRIRIRFIFFKDRIRIRITALGAYQWNVPRSHGTFIRWLLWIWCVHKDQSLLFDLLKAFDLFKSMQNQNFSPKRPIFNSCVRNMFWDTILYRYHACNTKQQWTTKAQTYFRFFLAEKESQFTINSSVLLSLLVVDKMSNKNCPFFRQKLGLKARWIFKLSFFKSGKLQIFK